MGMFFKDSRVDVTNEVNEAARLAIGNGGETFPDSGRFIGTTRGQKEAGQRKLDEMVASKTITPRQAKKAKEDALRQAGAKGGIIARKFGR